MDDLLAVTLIASDDEARRELLWLRAVAREDEEAQRDLEQIDPHITDRLRAAGADITIYDDELPDDRRAHFDHLFGACFDRHAQRLTGSRRGLLVVH